MEYTEIDMDTYPRQKHFEYFKQLEYPYVGVTVNIEITNWLAAIKQRNMPFFHSFLYAVSNAANSVPEFRQRILGDKIIEFEKCLCSYTVALEDSTYCYCVLDTTKTLEEFIPYAHKKQQEAVEAKVFEDSEDALSYFFVSSLPWISYTSMIQPVPMPADSNPRITWGKYFTQEEQVVIPVSVLCHHALVDGIHISYFFDRLKTNLKQI